MKNTGLVFGAAPIVSPLGSTAPPSVLKDRSRFKNDGTFTNVTWSQLPSGLWVMGFNGATSVSVHGSASSLDVYKGDSLTLSGWAYCTGGDGAVRIISGAFTSDGTTGRRYAIGNSSSNTFLFYQSDGTTAINLNSNFTPKLNVWYFLCATYTSAPYRGIYVNGILANSSVVALGISPSFGAAIFSIGRASSTFYWPGQIALPCIYNYALSADQISRIYEAERRWFV